VSGLAELVKREGFAVAVTGTLREARREIAARPPDIILADLSLPDGTGIELLSAFEAGKGPEIVLITGNASLETAVDALRCGATDYLTKPIDVARLKVTLAVLARTVDSRGHRQRRRHRPSFLGHLLRGVHAARQVRRQRLRMAGLGRHDRHGTCELHGGTISAASPGLSPGSTFRVALPLLAREGETAAGIVSESSAGLSPAAVSLRVLVVEDHGEVKGS
jgi:DNA-binding response OmpR family regulator